MLNLGRLRPLAVACAGVLVLSLVAGDGYAFLRRAPGAPAVAADEPSERPASETPAAPTAGQPVHQARQAIDAKDFYDPANPDYARLQRIGEATRQLPYDAIGFPDWMRALREGKIKPRYNVRGDAQPELLDLDVIMKNTKEMPAVRFPHLPHTQWLACANCHPAPFKAEKGANSIRMADIFRGQYCGMCHDRVAFITFYSCARCHSVPAAGTKPASN